MTQLILLICLLYLPISGWTASSKSAKPISYASGTSGVLLDLGVYFGQSKATANPSANNEWTDLTSIYDVKLGYILSSGFYLGGQYSVRSQSATSTNLTANTGSTAAVGGGYFWDNGFHIRGFYLLDDSFGDYSSGTGFQGDLGYMLNMSSSFYMGFLISHRQVTFKQNTKIARFDFWNRTETYPFITLGFLIR